MKERGAYMPSTFEREVLKLLPAGYTLAGKGHKRLVDPGGAVVRRYDGKPLTVPNSPGDHRALKIMRTRLRECGIDV